METPRLPVDSENFILSFQRPGMGHTTCVQAYDKETSVKLYAECAVALAYRGPQYCADMLSALLPNKEAVILDVAAGTGLVGGELKKRGFCNIHAHDGSLNMLDTCKQKGIYSNFIHCLLGDGSQLPVSRGTYDALVMSGGTCENHLPPSAQREFIRVIKPGGYFINAYRSTMPDIEYGKMWQAESDTLEDEKKWLFYGRLCFRKYNLFADGLVDIYQVC